MIGPDLAQLLLQLLNLLVAGGIFFKMGKTEGRLDSLERKVFP